MQDYRSQQAESKQQVIIGQITDIAELHEIEEQIMSLAIIDSKNEIERIESSKYYTKRHIQKTFRQLPKKLMPLLERLTKNKSEEYKHGLHYTLSKFYYLSPNQRAEEAFVAKNKLVELNHRELDKKLKEAQEYLEQTQLTEKITLFGKNRSFEVRLDRFQYCAKKLQQKGFEWYVTSQVCGEAYLQRDDMMNIEEMKENSIYDSYKTFKSLPNNPYWVLRGNFRKRSFIHKHGDLDWLMEWMIREKEQCRKYAETEKTYWTNFYDNLNAYERFNLKAYDSILIEKLSDEEVFEKLRKQKPAILDDTTLKTAIFSARRQIEKEEKDRIFFEEFEEEFVKEELKNLVVTKKPDKITIKGKIMEE